MLKRVAVLACAILMAAASAARAADQLTGSLRVTTPQPARDIASVVVTSESTGRVWTARVDGGATALVDGLPPDRYRMVVTLQGGATATLDLEIGLAETVCVEAASPAAGAPAALRIIDRYRFAQGTYFDRRQLSEVPVGSGVAPLLDTAAPFVVGDRLDSGGLGLGLMPRVSGEAASFVHSWVSVAGFESPRVPGTGDERILAPAVAAAQAIAVAPEMAPADVASPGTGIAFVPRMPGRLRQGAVGVDFTTPGMVSANQTPTAPSIERLDTWRSASAEFGGPVTRRTGLFVAASTGAMRKFERDWPGAVDSRLTSAFAHVVANPDPRTQVRVIGSIDDARRPYGAIRPFRVAGVDERAQMFRLNGTWERVREGGGRLEAAAGYQRGVFTPSGSLPDSVVVDRAVDGILPAPTGRTAIDRLEGRLSVTPPPGRRHAFEIGALVAHNAATKSVTSTPVLAELVYGLPACVWIPATPASESSRRAYHLAGYISDRVHLGPQVTLNLGLRAGASFGSAQGGPSVTWPALLPRTAVRWTSKWASAFGGYARYQADMPLDVLAFGDPGESVLSVYRWNDANANRRLEKAEIGTLVARAGRGPAVASIDDGLRSPHTDEVVLGAERPWGRHMTLRLTQVWRREHSLTRSVNVGAPISSYQPIVIPDRGEDYDGATDDRPLTIYDRLPSSFGLDRFVLMNTDDVAEYNSTEIAWTLRARRWWSMVGMSSYDTWGFGANVGFRADERDQGLLGELRENPNAGSYARGAVFFDRQYVLKWSTGFHGWRDLSVATVARYQDGQAFSRILVAPDLAQGPELVNTYRSGRTRFTFTLTIDARIEKGFSIGGRRAAVRLEVYNLSNVDNEFEEDPISGANFRLTTAVQPPRAVRLGVHFGF